MQERTEFRLLVLNERQSLEIPFTQQITIGRDVVNALALQDKETSRSHAILYSLEENGDDDQLAVKDLDSLNGVYVNGVKVKECNLKPGDELVIGASIILVSPDPETDLEDCLSEKGLSIFNKIKSPKPFKPAPITSFLLEDLRQLAEREFTNLENTAIWSPRNAATMMRAMVDLAEAETEAEFFRVALKAAADLVQADQGVVMLRETEGSALDIRAYFSNQSRQSITISQRVIRIVMRGDQAFYSPDVANDDRLSDPSKKPKKDLPHSLLAIPFERDVEAVGFLYLDSMDPNFSYDSWSLILMYLLVQPCVQLAALKGFLPDGR